MKLSERIKLSEQISFPWVPRAAQEDRERDAGCTAELEASDPDQPWDLVSDTLIGDIYPFAL